MLLTHLFRSSGQEPAPNGLFDGSPPVAEGSAFREIMQGFQFAEEESGSQTTGPYPSLADLIAQVIAQDGEAAASGPFRMPSDNPAQGTTVPHTDVEPFPSEAIPDEARIAPSAETETPSAPLVRTATPPPDTHVFLPITETAHRGTARSVEWNPDTTPRPAIFTGEAQTSPGPAGPSQHVSQHDVAPPPSMTGEPVAATPSPELTREGSIVAPSDEAEGFAHQTSAPGREVSAGVETPQPPNPASRIDGSGQTRPASTVDVIDRSTATSGPQMDTVEDTQVTHQIVRGARFLSRTNLNQITIRLDPPELGEVTVQLASRNQAVTGEIRVENRAVQEIVQRNLAELRESLNGQGIQIDRIEVSVDAGGRSAVDRDGENLLHDRSGREDASRQDRDGNPDLDEHPSQKEGYRNRSQDGRVDFVA
jgi:hypothetical protein